MISKELLEELSVLLREEYGVKFKDKDLKIIGDNLIKYFDLLTKVNVE